MMAAKRVSLCVETIETLYKKPSGIYMGNTHSSSRPSTGVCIFLICISACLFLIIWRAAQLRDEIGELRDLIHASETVEELEENIMAKIEDVQSDFVRARKEIDLLKRAATASSRTQNSQPRRANNDSDGPVYADAEASGEAVSFHKLDATKGSHEEISSQINRDILPTENQSGNDDAEDAKSAYAEQIVDVGEIPTSCALVGASLPDLALPSDLAALMNSIVTAGHACTPATDAGVPLARVVFSSCSLPSAGSGNAPPRIEVV